MDKKKIEYIDKVGFQYTIIMIREDWTSQERS